MASIVVRGVAISAVGELVKELGQAFVDALSAGAFSVSQPHAGAVWITALDGRWGSYNGQVVSCYYHPSKHHTATTEGRLGTKKSQAAGGHWAISAQTRAMFGNRAYYDTN